MIVYVQQIIHVIMNKTSVFKKKKNSKRGRTIISGLLTFVFEITSFVRRDMDGMKTYKC